MKRKICFFVLGLMAMASLAFGQVRPDSTQLAAFEILYTRFDSALAIHWNEQTGTPDIITVWKLPTFARNARVSAQLFLQEIRGLFKERVSEDRLEFDRVRETAGIQHLRFQQVYKGVPVRGGEYVVTVLPGNKVQTALGGFYRDIQLDVNPKLSAQQALTFARQNPPPNVELKDSLNTFQLIVYPKDGTYHLAWELRVPSVRGFGEWVYIVDAFAGEILKRFDEVFDMMVPQAYGNVYLRHPGLDANYSTVYLYRMTGNGYIQGTYANVLNSVAARAYSYPDHDFRYQPSDTHFDEANLYYHIDRFRYNFWNALGFNAFTQITANAHHNYDSNGNYAPNNAYFRPSTGQLYFGDGVYSGYNSFAKEDKIIMHEYTHAVTHYIANLSYDYTESGAIHEGNSDYFAGTFTGRTLIGEYSSYGVAINQRDMLNPRIANYTQYNDPNYYIYGGKNYGFHEPHFGGELWSACLWDMRSYPNIGSYYADRLTYNGLFAIPTTSTFLQYRQAIIDKDNSLYGGVHANKIAHIFYLRGIGPDSVRVTITGPTELMYKHRGTWTANPSGGNGSYTYEWRSRYNGTGPWSGVLGTSRTYSQTMFDTDFELQVKVTSQGLIAYDTHYVEYVFDKPVLPLLTEEPSLPEAFLLAQNFPNPFNPETEIRFGLPEETHVQIVVIDLLGREVRKLVDSDLKAGYHSVIWNGKDNSGNEVASGIYVYQMVAGSFRDCKKLALVR
ncbi:MAG: M36 family metallopeptidase [candidate division KSB1 bacterium]|nr:M36 family metallopeptidase [candidate division KSB1 bacterium]